MQANILVNTLNIEHEEWLKQRQRGIGGSDAAAICGLNPWKSPITVYLDKIGQSETAEDNERMRIGRDLEDYVAQRFSEATGLKVRRRNAILQHSEYPFMLANVDRLIVGKDEGLECKVTNSYAKKEWEEEIPPHYEIQCHHYMMVTGYKAWWIAVLIGNEKFIYKKINRDEEVINYLISLEKSFWENHVLSRQMPAPDGSYDADKLIKSMYPESKKGKILSINKDEFKNKLKRRDEIMELIKKLEREKNQIDQEIQFAMKEAERAYISNRVVSWSTVHRTRFNYKDFKKDYPDLYKQYAQKMSYRRFQVR
jgi:putative phage-type endonuclease